MNNVLAFGPFGAPIHVDLIPDHIIKNTNKDDFIKDMIWSEIDIKTNGPSLNGSKRAEIKLAPREGVLDRTKVARM